MVAPSSSLSAEMVATCRISLFALDRLGHLLQFFHGILCGRFDAAADHHGVGTQRGALEAFVHDRLRRI